MVLKPGTGYALAAVMIWSTVATAFKLSLRHLGPAELLAYASLFSLMAIAFILSATNGWARLKKLNMKNWLGCALLGILNPAIYYTILFHAYDRLPAQIAQPLNYTWALALALIAIPVLGHRFRRRTIPAFLLGLAGVTFLSYGSWSGVLGLDILGTVLALSSSIVWALYWAYLTRSKLDADLKLFIGFLTGTPIVFGIAGATGGLALTLAGLIGTGYIGVLEMGVTFFLWSQAMARSNEAADVAVWIYASPFISLVFIHYILGEPILWTTPIGLVMIVIGILIQTYGRKGLKSAWGKIRDKINRK